MFKKKEKKYSKSEARQIAQLQASLRAELKKNPHLNTQEVELLVKVGTVQKEEEIIANRKLPIWRKRWFPAVVGIIALVVSIVAIIRYDSKEASMKHLIKNSATMLGKRIDSVDATVQQQASKEDSDVAALYQGAEEDKDWVTKQELDSVAHKLDSKIESQSYASQTLLDSIQRVVDRITAVEDTIKFYEDAGNFPVARWKELWTLRHNLLAQDRALTDEESGQIKKKEAK